MPNPLHPEGNAIIDRGWRLHQLRQTSGFIDLYKLSEALVQHVESPDLEIRLLFGKVRDTVLEKTNNNQEPHYPTGNLTEFLSASHAFCSRKRGLDLSRSPICLL